MAKERGVRPDCPNASNPFHICVEYCSRGATPRSWNPSKKETLVEAIPNGVGSKENREKIEGGRRNVNPSCVNASNPFHQCADYCSRNSDGKSPMKGFKLDGMSERVVMVDNRRVNPSCPNASNPFHQCANYCSQRTTVLTAGGNSRSSSNEGGSSRGILTVVERKDVDPRCANASNPFHKCAEYCSQRINGAGS